MKFMKEATLLGLIILLVSLAASGCRSVRRGDAIGRPVAKASAEVERGKVVFQQQCDRCHPGGEGGLGPSLNDKPLPAFLMKTQVRAGLGAMPGVAEDRVSQEQMDDLIAYIKALRHAEQISPVSR
jgi:mono/diheme cytochrome c family protein